MNDQLNQNIDAVLNMANTGRNPKDVMNYLFQQNPQLNQMMTQLQNMAQGRTPQEFITQLAQQNGIGQDRLDQLLKLIGRK